MDQQSDGLACVRVRDDSARYALEEYLTRTDDLEEFRRRAAPWSRVTRISDEEYERLLASDDPWDDDGLYCLARCLRREGISAHGLDREAVERIMRAVRDALGPEGYGQESK